jgi:AhpD family alkylhydroperoxidase
MGKLPQPYQQFKKEHARVWRAYDKLGAAAAEEGPLDQKTRELIRLGMAAATKSESAVHSHTHRALEAGATAAEVEHAIVLGVTTLGFPAMTPALVTAGASVTALTWAKAAVAAHQA